MSDKVKAVSLWMDEEEYSLSHCPSDCGTWHKDGLSWGQGE